jgi:hypothetical protein
VIENAKAFFTEMYLQIFVIKDLGLTFVEELHITDVQSVHFMPPDLLLIRSEVSIKLSRLK